jgi:hypothetical protein
MPLPDQAVGNVSRGIVFVLDQQDLQTYLRGYPVIVHLGPN